MVFKSCLHDPNAKAGLALFDGLGPKIDLFFINLKSCFSQQLSKQCPKKVNNVLKLNTELDNKVEFDTFTVRFLPSLTRRVSHR